MFSKFKIFKKSISIVCSTVFTLVTLATFTSIESQAYKVNKRNNIIGTFYADPNFTGKSFSLWIDNSTGNLIIQKDNESEINTKSRSFNFEDYLQDLNDGISSFKMSGRVYGKIRIWVYEHKDRAGSPRCVTSSVKDFGKSLLFDNRISSIGIQYLSDNNKILKKLSKRKLARTAVARFHTDVDYHYINLTVYNNGDITKTYWDGGDAVETDVNDLANGKDGDWFRYKNLGLVGMNDKISSIEILKYGHCYVFNGGDFDGQFSGSYDGQVYNSVARLDRCNDNISSFKVGIWK